VQFRPVPHNSHFFLAFCIHYFIWLYYKERIIAGKRKTPQLRFDGRYYVANIYQSDGKRNTISFGSLADRSEGQIYAAFGKWLDLYNQQPDKVLTYKNPYAAIEEIIAATSHATVGELLDAYLKYSKKTVKTVNSNKEHPDLCFIKRVQQFLKPYQSWSVESFGPDELHNVQKALLQHEYVHGKKKKKYTRRGINDVTKWIKRIWKWGVGRQFVRIERLHALDEV
jgi:hypothetical protein